MSSLTQLRRAIAGEDTFQPAQTDPATYFHHQITQAIRDNSTLEIDYQPLAADFPTTRQIMPYRTEPRGDLHYLYAYCQRPHLPTRLSPCDPSTRCLVHRSGLDRSWGKYNA